MNKTDTAYLKSIAKSQLYISYKRNVFIDLLCIFQTYMINNMHNLYLYVLLFYQIYFCRCIYYRT